MKIQKIHVLKHMGILEISPPIQPLLSVLVRCRLFFKSKFLNMINLGKVISNLRRNRNLRQNVLAEKTQIAASVLSRIENGKQKPNLNQLEKIGAELNMPVPVMMFLALDKGDIPEHKRGEFEVAYRNFKFLVEDVFKD